jgi:hypothetical protein
MRLVPRKMFFIYSSSAKYIPFASFTFSSGAAVVCSIPGEHFAGYHLLPALNTSACLLLTQNDVLSMPF